MTELPSANLACWLLLRRYLELLFTRPAGRKHVRHNMPSGSNNGWKILLQALVIFVLVACAGASGQAPAKQPIDADLAKLGNGFVSRTARVNGTLLHYVRGGAGPSLILLHGFPEDWYEFHHVIPLLAKKLNVVADCFRPARCAVLL